MFSFEREGGVDNPNAVRIPEHTTEQKTRVLSSFQSNIGHDRTEV